MARAKKTTVDNVVPLNPEMSATTEQESAQTGGAEKESKPKGKGGPTTSDCTAYDRLVQELQQQQEMTSCVYWSRFFGGLLREAEEARTGLESAEKTRDLLKLQVTIALVKSQLKKLKQPVEDLNGLRGRWPLFAHEMPWRGDFDELTGRVTLVWTGKGEAPQIPQPTQCATTAETQTASPKDCTASAGGLEEDEEAGEDLDPIIDDPEEDDPFGNA
jgi:hypothetical protein